MKTAHRNQSHAKRRWQADPQSIFGVIDSQTPHPKEKQDALNMTARLAFEKIKTGIGKYDDFHTLAATANISLICAERIDPLVEQTCVIAVDALVRTQDRYNRTQLLGFDGPALQAVPEMISIYEQLTALLTISQLRDAMQEVIRRIKNGDVKTAVKG